ncbi:hypothetical protein SAMN05216344_102116 [Polaromonas sp. OV174]|uniref:hypothetical protein n=1 Tax=Polaromonas sp. OV174 TaxID=1855300 RepID=UPI0008E098BF|nr:hypothetical protein [Polaromonas sp. OV174]SFB73429.1 hypothetical protein SAMN05216344_102116 [Polaromonas sp. OV174]
MNRQATRDHFLESAAEWICDSYSLSIHYLATIEQGIFNIVDATLSFYPLPPEKVDNFAIKAGNLLAGREIFSSLKKDEILQRLTQAASGHLEVHDLQLSLQSGAEMDYYSEIPHRDTGFSDLHLMVTGAHLRPASLSESIVTDNALRLATPPFDGMSDICSWLQLTDTRVNGRAPSITLRIGPPVDIIFDETKVHRNKLRLTLSAHPKFDTSRLVLATREFPGRGIETRKQASNLIVWKQVKKGRRSGVLNLDLTNANSVLAMLIVGRRTVRRRWFDDPEKAINSRYVATQLFDKDLKQLKHALLEAVDSVRFEQGVASLLFLLGFSSAIQVETQAPDILVTSPGGKLAIVECTTKISDFQNKLGKLVDRRNALMKTLETTGHNLQVYAFLACGLPKAQIAVEERQLTQHQVTLFSRENISLAFDQLRTPTSPDEMLDRAAALLSEKRNAIA